MEADAGSAVVLSAAAMTGLGGKRSGHKGENEHKGGDLCRAGDAGCHAGDSLRFGGIESTAKL
jgi:hypothetical protein